MTRIPIAALAHRVRREYDRIGVQWGVGRRPAIVLEKLVKP